MRDRQDHLSHFEMLELTPEASHGEVKSAYRMLKEIYAEDSLALMAVVEEISGEQTEDILLQIEASYLALSAMFNEEQHLIAEFVDRIVAEITEFNGEVLQGIRHQLAVSLDDMAMVTRVPYNHLVNIEADKFGELPVAVYTRGFVCSYAKFLSLDPELVAKSYMANFRHYHQEGEDSQLTRSSIILKTGLK